MTDIERLAFLYDYYGAQREVALSMICAMHYFELGREQDSFEYLFNWCRDKDRRDELFSKFNNDYLQAMMLKEGYE